MTSSRSADTTFDALGTYVYVGVRRPRDLAAAESLARVILADIDQVASRFRPDSDLMQVNAHPGQWVGVDPLLVAAVTAACWAAEQTDGLVNPLLGRSMVALGYDQDFATLRRVPAAESTLPMIDSQAWRRIRTDPDGAVRIPSGTALDLGSSGKAFASDTIAAAFTAELEGAALVSVGGDLRISETDDEPWRIAIGTHPGRPEIEVDLAGGGLATSSTRVRRWSQGSVQRHHLIDPRTGGPTPEIWATVTATGPTCLAANAASTAAIVLGPDAPSWLARRDVAAGLVAATGRVRTTGGWPPDPDVIHPGGSGEWAPTDQEQAC